MIWRLGRTAVYLFYGLDVDRNGPSRAPHPPGAPIFLGGPPVESPLFKYRLPHCTHVLLLKVRESGLKGLRGHQTQAQAVHGQSWKQPSRGSELSQNTFV